ncbi:uncharacterized protein LOC143254498 isoform X1 [Tachypleus tridentatus]|uniref:uncharacterized protein LOC143254498 isoform X1 n=1 Tax=Tachypleus tridentatus TaxID=6853 RepID=UPI003FD038FB
MLSIRKITVFIMHQLRPVIHKIRLLHTKSPYLIRPCEATLLLHAIKILALLLLLALFIGNHPGLEHIELQHHTRATTYSVDLPVAVEGLFKINTRVSWWATYLFTGKLQGLDSISFNTDPQKCEMEIHGTAWNIRNDNLSSSNV